ncbi:MAG: SMEK domain-containing protein [Mangrovibacterium sp.]
MPREEQQIKAIIRFLNLWILEINSSNALNFFDINKISEGICLQLLNLIFNLRLTDLNALKNNYPGIDLGDFDSGIAFQVTSRNDLRKIKQTLNLFYNSDSAKIFSGGVKLLILKNSKKRTKKIIGYEDVFNTGKDIIYPQDLVKSITDVYRTDPLRFRRINDLLDREFGNLGDFHANSSVITFDSIAAQIEFYKKIQSQINTEILKHFVHFYCTIEDKKLSTEELFSEPFRESGKIIIGSSGCGKSLLARKLSLDFSEKNGVILYLEAKYYESNLNAIVNNEVQKYGFPSGTSFFNSCKRVQEKILIVIDGLNECSLQKRISLTIELKEVLKKYKETNFIITTQIWDEQLKELGETVISVGLPEKKVKKAIAETYCHSSGKLDSVLDVAKTSLEANMIGEMSSSIIIEKVSRFDLFELFVRQKLSKTHPSTIFFLSLIAKLLKSTISFSLSIRQIGRIIEENNFPPNILDKCLTTGLLVKNITKISFTHEMFLSFFSAGSIAESSDGKSIIEDLKAPKNRESRLFIIGAIEKPMILDEVLSSISDPDLLKSLLFGEGGEYSQTWATNNLSRIIEKIGCEINNLDFEITEDVYWPIQLEEVTLTDWTNQELAFINTMPDLLLSGRYLEEMFEIVKRMDEVCKGAFTKLQEEAKGRQIGLYSGLFSAVYSYNGGRRSNPALYYIFYSFTSGLASYNSKNEITIDSINKLLKNRKLSNGQFYLLLYLCEYDEKAKLLFPYILDALKNKWRFIPHTLRIEILQRVGHCYSSEEQRLSLIECLNIIHANTHDPLLSTNIFDALSDLGALDDDALAYEDTVKKQLEWVLTDQENKANWNEAAGIFYALFDHPYQIAYSNVMDNLNLNDSKNFLRMALRGSDDTLFASPLIFRAVSLLGSEVCPYLLKFIGKPITNEVTPQESLEVFFTTHVILAQFSYPIESRFKENEDDELSKTLFACAEVFYWLNRMDLDLYERKEYCLPSSQVLFKPLSNYTIECIWYTEVSLRSSLHIGRLPEGSVVFISQLFSGEIAKSCREAITNPDRQKGIFNFCPPEDIVKHAIWLLERSGDISDLTMFRSLSSHPIYGECAIAAIKHLEER